MPTLVHPVPGGTQTDRYGNRGNVPGVGNVGFHTGNDWAAPAGTPILAAQSGTILRKWWDTFTNGRPAGGNMVSIRHDDGTETRYAHMAVQSPLNVGTRVRAGQQIGQVGRTGAANGNHLHFELLINGKFVDPLPYIGSGGSKQLGDKFMRLTNDTGGKGYLVTEDGFYWLEDMNVYNLFKRLIDSSTAAPDKFTRAEIERMNSVLAALRTGKARF